jgi:hypothetical protein
MVPNLSESFRKSSFSEKKQKLTSSLKKSRTKNQLETLEALQFVYDSKFNAFDNFLWKSVKSFKLFTNLDLGTI